MTTALVVSGGGSKGAFAVGALEVLINEFQETFDIVAGTSTGALIAPFVAAGEHNQLANLYLRMRTEHFLEKKKNVALSLFFSHAIFDVKPFQKVLRDVVKSSMAKAVLQNSAPYTIIATVSLQKGDVVYFHTLAQHQIAVPPGTRKIKIRDRDHLLEVMEASSNQPVFMKPKRIKIRANQPAAEVEQFVDGGVREYAPIRVAVENGADRVYAILLGPEKKRPEKGQFQSAFRILTRTFELFMDDIGANDVATADLVAQQKGAAIRYIRPKREFLTNSLEISSIVQGRMLEDGRRMARNAGPLP